MNSMEFPNLDKQKKEPIKRERAKRPEDETRRMVKDAFMQAAIEVKG